MNKAIENMAADIVNSGVFERKQIAELATGILALNNKSTKKSDLIRRRQLSEALCENINRGLKNDG